MPGSVNPPGVGERARRHAERPACVVDPMQAYYSPTRYARDTFAEMTFCQGVIDIVVGRRPLLDYDGLVSDWRKAAGDQMRKEYLDAVAANA